MTRAFLLAAAVLAVAASSASATVMQIVNQRGIPQIGIYYLGSSSDAIPTDYYGRTADLAPGTSVRMTRGINSGSCRGTNAVGAPEGGGIEMPVPAADPPNAVLPVTVPNASGDAYKPELSDAERWIVGKINERRAAKGVAPVGISTPLRKAADSNARRQVSQGVLFPGPYCSLMGIDWGFPTFSIGGVDAGGTSPQAAFAYWSDGSARETQVTSPMYDAIGIGDGDGAYVALLSKCDAAFTDRCEMTDDQGDPSIVLPAPPGGAGPGATTPGGSTPGGSTPGGSAPGGTVPVPKAVTALTVAARQKGKKVKGSLTPGQAGTNVSFRLLLGAKRVGTAKVQGLAAKAAPFGVALGHAGKKALAKKGKLKLVLEVVLDPPKGANVTVTRKVTLRR